MKRRIRIHVRGRVQGVGFRPAVFRHAAAYGLSGFVRNTPAGVLIEAEGKALHVARFMRELKGNPPPRAKVESMRFEEITHGSSPEDTAPFQIMPSARSGDPIAGMPPDIATCRECRDELFDSSNRRYRYPFLNCTNCGPRFSIIRSLPYDRDRTSMAVFRFCPKCKAEYDNPADRRFEAQPNACAECGPRLQMMTRQGVCVQSDPIKAAARLLRKGAILAVKGIGGYHLCCDASSDQAVQLLRTRKNRPHKAFAVMFADLQDLRRYAEINEIEAGQITSWTAPIVVVRRKPHPEQQQGAPPLSLSVSPDTDDIGAFLPYSPLHHLLLQEAAPLVMTSGNLAEEPIAKDEEDLKRLMGSLADAALLHNREIIRRCDDSVIKIVNEKPLVLRRSRGLVPDPLPLPFTGPPVLACGAEMKNTVCVTRGKQAFVSPHIGDLADFRAYRFFIDTINDLQRLLSVAPEIVAHDAHPDYPSTRYALGLDTKIRTPVQHHHAHIASCMAEHGIAGPVIGVALDGTGFGPDGTIWGGEFLVADFMKWRRAAHFKQYRMPGGEQAVLNPVRMALSYLLSDLPPDMHRLIRQLLPTLTDREWNVLPHMIEHEVRSPATSSAGRLFDAAAALLGMAEPVSYEGRAAVRLQALASRGKVSTSYPFHIERDEAPAVVSFRDTIRGMVSDIRAGIDKNVIAASFHNTIADAVAKTCAMIRINERIDAVALSGGVFQNEFLLRLAGERLIRNGFRVYTHRLMPPNDGGISLGQAAVAMARLGNEYVE